MLKLTLAKPKNYTMPEIADKAAVKEWVNNMLSGHQGGRATTCEQWGDLFALLFKGVVKTIFHLLRIKEDFYNNMFVDNEKALVEAKVTPERAQTLHDEAEVIKTKEAAYIDTIHKLEIEVNFLKEKVDVSSENWLKK